MKDSQKLKELIISMVDFAYAIKLDEKTVQSGGIAVTMSEAIQEYGAKAIEILIKES